MIRFIGTSLQLQPIITAHKQWLSKTRPFLTGPRMSSLLLWRMTKDESLVHTLNSFWMNSAQPKSKSNLCYDRRSAGQSVLEQSTHLGLTSRSLLLSDSCGFVGLGRPLWREDGSAVCNCYWPSPMQSFSGPSPVGLVAIFYCLRFETSLFVASYDSQGHGGGTRPRLHTGILCWAFSCVSLFNFVRTEYRHRLEHLVVIPLYPLQRKRVLASRYLANWLPFVRCYSGFQAVFTEPLPSSSCCQELGQDLEMAVEGERKEMAKKGIRLWQEAFMCDL
jgi:hypothetical protein